MALPYESCKISAAEDVTIDVYAQVYRQVSSYDANRGTLGVAVTLTRSRAIDRLRQEAQGGNERSHLRQRRACRR